MCYDVGGRALTKWWMKEGKMQITEYDTYSEKCQEEKANANRAVLQEA